MFGVAPPEASLPQLVIQHWIPSVGSGTVKGRHTRCTYLRTGEGIEMKERSEMWKTEGRGVKCGKADKY